MAAWSRLRPSSPDGSRTSVASAATRLALDFLETRTLLSNVTWTGAADGKSWTVSRQLVERCRADVER